MSARKATRRLSAEVRDGFLWVSMAGGGEQRWSLPALREGAGVRSLSERAQEWARSQGATYGQEKAVHKALTSAGYYITSPRA